MKQIFIIETSNGPKMYTRHVFNFKPLLKVLLTILLIIASFTVGLTLLAVHAPTVEVHCINGTLVFQGIESKEYLAYVSSASQQQLEDIKHLNIVVDPSVDDFITRSTDVHHYKIRLDGDKCFVHADNEASPSEYNRTLTPSEVQEVLNASSEEVRYLYNELNRIFQI